ncbi:MAG TPA: hypothetical protein VFL85_04410 [Candidatus Saccharimonadales bacterium]|nr:hypothetical protein [Candidatus Saccharimonadales bacterium]
MSERNVYQELSDGYEQSIRNVNTSRRLGKAIPICTGAIAAANHFIAGLEFDDPYVSGPVAVGLVLGAGAYALARFEEHSLKDPVEEAFMKRFRDEVND